MDRWSSPASSFYPHLRPPPEPRLGTQGHGHFFLDMGGNVAVKYPDLST